MKQLKSRWVCGKCESKYDDIPEHFRTCPKRSKEQNIRIKIKALSVNEAWQGRRFKTQKYTAYARELLLLLPKMDIKKDCKLVIETEIGYSNKQADIDNYIKPFLDVLQTKYQFNDNRIYELKIKKIDVAKGEEFISWTLSYL